MRYFLTALLAIFSLQIKAASLECSVAYNENGPYDLKIDLKTEERNKLVGELAEYKIYASQKEEGLFELQTLDLGFDQRSYSSAEIGINEKIEISHWKRGALFEVKCVRTK